VVVVPTRASAMPALNTSATNASEMLMDDHIAPLYIPLRWRDEKLLPALLRFVQVGEFDGSPSFPTTSTGLNASL
jgi:hypothetical protein